MVDKDLRFRVSAADDTSRTFSAISAAAKREMGKVDQSIDGSKSKGKQLADVFEKLADDLDGNFHKTEQAAERLGDAMGPELRAKVDMDGLIKDFQRAGLSIEEITEDADQFAAAVARIDQVSERAGQGVRRAFDDADDALKRTAESGDQSRSVLANMAGNATSELPGIGTALGPVNVALGQMAEYAADGNIKLRSLVGLGAGMAALGVGISAVSSHFERIARADAFSDDKVAAWVDGMREGKSLTEAIAENYERAGKVEVEIGNQVVDLTGKLADLGLTVDQFATLTTMSQEGVQDWAERMRAAGVDGEALNMVLVALGSEADDVARTEEGAAVNAAVFGDQSEQTAEQIAKQTAALQENIDALHAQSDALNSSAEADLSYRDAIDATQDALTDYTTAVAEHGVASEEATDAERDLEGSIYAAGEAARVNAETQATAAGRAASATREGVAAQIDTLFRLALNLEEGSPARNAIEGHIRALQKIPENIETEVRLRVNQLTGGASSWFGGGRASGGPTREGGMYEVNEHGSELLHEGGRTYLMAGADGRVEPISSSSGAAGGGGITVNVTAGFGADGDEIANKIVDLLSRWQRSNGSLPWAS